MRCSEQEEEREGPLLDLLQEIRDAFPAAWLAISDDTGEALRPSCLRSFMRQRSLPFHGAGALLADLDTLLVYLHGHRPHTLEVRDSLIEGAGQGLFVTQPFHRGDVLCVYRGTPLTLRQFLVTYNRDYVMGGFGLNVHVDARPHPEVLARYINDNFAANSRNVAFVKLRGFPEALVVALRHIAPGEELYASYGEVYWRAKERRKGASQKPPVDVDDGATCSVDVTQNSGDVKSNQSISQ